MTLYCLERHPASGATDPRRPLPLTTPTASLLHLTKYDEDKEECATQTSNRWTPGKETTAEHMYRLPGVDIRCARDASADIRRLDGGFARNHFGAGIQEQEQQGIPERAEGRCLFQRRGLPSANQDHQAELRQARVPSTKSGFVHVVEIPVVMYKATTPDNRCQSNHPLLRRRSGGRKGSRRGPGLGVRPTETFRWLGDSRNQRARSTVLAMGTNADQH